MLEWDYTSLNDGPIGPDSPCEHPHHLRWIYEDPLGLHLKNNFKLIQSFMIARKIILNGATIVHIVASGGTKAYD